MPLNPTWQDIGLLALTMVAGAVIGFNRGERGHAAGLSTTILVGLAASVAMIQANARRQDGGLFRRNGSDASATRDPHGVGFIGGGTILRRGDLVTGVTIAATLWVMTVIGLCLGGGQLELGIAATLLAVITLWVLKWADLRTPREQRATVAIKADLHSSVATELADFIAPSGYKAQFRRMSRSRDEEELWFEVSWTRSEIADSPLALVKLVGDAIAWFASG